MTRHDLRHSAAAIAVFASLSASVAFGDPALIEAAEAQNAGDTWTFSVTIRHGDTGWDDYADGWRVLTPEGGVLGTRVLHHPHETEQPFTRSLSGVEIPPEIGEVMIEARTSVTGWDSALFPITLQR